MRKCIECSMETLSLLEGYALKKIDISKDEIISMVFEDDEHKEVKIHIYKNTFYLDGIDDMKKLIIHHIDRMSDSRVKQVIAHIESYDESTKK